MEKKDKNNNLILVICTAVIFGLIAGISGGLITRSYLLNDIYSIPFYGKINISGNDVRSGLIIDNAKSIVIEQDKQVSETVKSSLDSIVGIFKRIENKEGSDNFDYNANYRLKDSLSEGLIITSDGWVVFSDFLSGIAKEKIIKDYVAVSSEKKIYNIDDLVLDPQSKLNFIHLKDAKDLSVKQFSSKENISPGQMVIALNWQGETLITYIIGKKTSDNIVRSSDVSNEKLIFSDNLSKDFKDSFVFNLRGELVAILDTKGEIKIIDYFNPLIEDLLNKKDMLRPSLGINYLDLSEFASQNDSWKKGALIYPNTSGVSILKGSSAEKAGLIAGDIIISVDNTEIKEGKDLSSVIQKYSAGDIINIVYRRGGEEKRIELTLGELK